jgi:hypothetical protein
VEVAEDAVDAAEGDTGMGAATSQPMDAR